MQCTIEVFDQGHWHKCCSVEIHDPSASISSSSTLTYFPEYVGKEHLPVSVHYPVRTEPYYLNHWPSFLMEMIPRGQGREFLLIDHHLPDNEKSDCQLTFLGGICPSGHLRIREALDAYHERLRVVDPKWIRKGFTLEEILVRSEAFIEYLDEHGMLSSGTTSLQGSTPKFFMTRSKQGLWYADAVLPDRLVDAHYLIKLSKGRNRYDWKILKNEALYQKIAIAMGITSTHGMIWRDDMLFIPRYDREVTAEGVQRYQVESLASLCDTIKTDDVRSHMPFLQALRQYATDPVAATIEYIQRDMLNLALGNPNNHPGNTAVGNRHGVIALTPIFDFAPSYLFVDRLERYLEWFDVHGSIIRDWSTIIDMIPADNTEKQIIWNAVSAFGKKIGGVEQLMREYDVDDDIIGACSRHIASVSAQF